MHESYVFQFSNSFFEQNNCAIDGPNLNDAFNAYDDGMSDIECKIKEKLIDYRNRFTFGLLNINSINSKFDNISFLLKKQMVDVLVLNETKIDHTVDASRFSDDHYK